MFTLVGNDGYSISCHVSQFINILKVLVVENWINRVTV